MAAPVLNVTYNKSVYAPGEAIQATVDYSDPDTKTENEVWKGTNQNGEQGTVTVSKKVVDAVTIVPPPGSNYVMVPGSDTGSQVKFTGTA